MRGLFLHFRTRCRMIILGLTLSGLVTAGPNFTYTGVQAFRQNIQLNGLKFDSRAGLISWFFTDGAYYGHFGLGMADHKLESDLQNAEPLKSNMKFMWNFDVTRMMRMVYFSTGINYYNISGDADVIDGEDIYTYRNRYRLYEFPVGTGLHLNFGNVFVKIGYRRNYYYGKHHYTLLLTQNTSTIQLNAEKNTFDDRSEKFYEGALSLTMMRNFYFEAHYAYNQNSNEEYLSFILGFRL
ncbi:MAG: hypothetical protein GXO91_01875 [FCB group bacterium]|nr:hypothetical protein [FCB group bacterium]